MRIYYIGCIEGEGDNWGIWFPDFMGCVSAADTFEEVVAMGEEVLNFHVNGMLRDDDPIPGPRHLEAILEDPEMREWAEGCHFVSIPLHDVGASVIAAE